MIGKISILTDDYIKVMPAIADEDEVVIKRYAALMLSGFEAVKADKKAISVLREKLIIYAEQAPNAPVHYDAIEYLLYSMDALL